MMVRGGCFPVRGSDRMTWKYDNDKCRCGLVEQRNMCYLNAFYMEQEDGEGLL